MSDEREGYGAMAAEYANDHETPGRGRSREERHATPPTWRPPTLVEKAPCMVPGCKNVVDVTDEAMLAFVTFSKQLAAIGEQPLELGKVFNCEACGRVRAAASLDKSAARTARTTRSIRVLKGLEKSTPEDEREAEKWLEKIHGKGYLVDLLRTIADKRAAGGKKPRREEI